MVSRIEGKKICRSTYMQLNSQPIGTCLLECLSLLDKYRHPRAVRHTEWLLTHSTHAHVWSLNILRMKCAAQAYVKSAGFVRWDKRIIYPSHKGGNLGQRGNVCSFCSFPNDSCTNAWTNFHINAISWDPKTWQIEKDSKENRHQTQPLEAFIVSI